MNKIKLTFLLFMLGLNLLISQNPTIDLSPLNTSVYIGEATSFNVSINNSGSFSQQIFFDIDSTDMPIGLFTYSFTPSVVNYPYSASVVLSIQTTGIIAPGTYFIIVSGSNGPFVTTDTCYLTVLEAICNWTNINMPNGYYLNYGLTRDLGGNFWITTGNGILKTNGSNWTLFNNSNSNFPLANYGISKVRCDSLNNIWLAAYNVGLVKFDGIYWTIFSTATSSIPTNNINGFDIDINGNLWLSTEDSGIIKFDGSVWTNYNSINTNLPFNRTGKIKSDRQGNIWVAGYPNSSTNEANFIAKFNGVTWTIFDDVNSCFTHTQICSNLAFDVDNNLWFSAGFPQYTNSTSIGLVKFNESNWECWLDSTSTPYNHYIKTTNCSIQQQDNLSKLPVSHQREIVFDSNENMWLANLSNTQGWGTGITKYKGSNWKTFVPASSNLPVQAVYGICWSNDSLWTVEGPDFYGGTTSNYLSNYSCSPLSSPTGLNSLNQEQHNLIKIYPTLTEGRINICGAGNKKIEILNSMGSVVFSGPALTEDKLSLNLNYLNCGLYFARFIDGNGSVTIVKFLKE